MAKIGLTALRALKAGSANYVDSRAFNGSLDQLAEEAEIRTLKATVGAEVGNIIPVVLQLVELDGDTAIESTDAWIAEIPGRAAAAFRVNETGVGTPLSPADQATQLFRLDAEGKATISVTDVAGASGATVAVVFRPADFAGQPVTASVVFD